MHKINGLTIKKKDYQCQLFCSMPLEMKSCFTCEVRENLHDILFNLMKKIR